MANEPEITPEYRHAKFVADGYLTEQGFDPSKVYAFLDILEGAPDITSVRFGNTTEFIAGAKVTAEYSGDEHWGGMATTTGVGAGLACDKFQKTARSIFEALADYTGYEITTGTAEVFDNHPDRCHAKVYIGNEKLSMIVTKASQE